MTAPQKRFRVALSFPGEHRAFVERVAAYLGAKLGRERILYDKYYEAEFARPDLDTYLQRLYHDESELIVVFLCADYERKEWCGLEWRAVRDLIKRRRASAVMPLRFDMTEIPGLFSTDGYVWIGDRSAEDIARLILERIGSTGASQERNALGAQSIAKQAREAAARIEALADDVIRSFASPNPQARVACLQGRTNEILFGMTAVVGWVERRRHPGTAELLKRRLLYVAEEAAACAAYDTPEYAGGRICESVRESASEGAKRTATLLVTAKAFAELLRRWADEIEAEDVQCAEMAESHRNARFADDVLDKLKLLPSAQFEELVFRFDRGNAVPGRNAPQADRAVELLRLVRSQEGALARLCAEIQRMKACS